MPPEIRPRASAPQGARRSAQDDPTLRISDALDWPPDRSLGEPAVASDGEKR